MITLEQFREQVEREFIEKSAIARKLYAATIRVLSDIEIDPGGEVSTPIHDAMGWRYVRFGRQVKPTLYAAQFLNEDGTTWQIKANRALFKGSDRRYGAPAGCGSRCWLPHIDQETRRKVAERHSIEVPTVGSFWDWLYYHPTVPIIITEGGKKAAALLSQGYVALALFGVDAWVKEKGSRELCSDLARFVCEGRRVTLAFDCGDPKPETRKRVKWANVRLSAALRKAGATVSIATWPGSQGKGIDDLIAAHGPTAADAAIAAALPFEHWEILKQLQGQLTYKASLQMPLDEIDADQLPTDGIVAIAAAKGTGKTKLMIRATEDSLNSLALGHRIALMRNLCARFGLDYRGDIKGPRKAGIVRGSAYSIGLGACVDALLSLNPEDFEGCDLILDEVLQVVRHLLTSKTCAQDGKRPALLARFRALLKAARRVIVADADLNNAVLHYLQGLRDDGQPVYLVKGYAPQQQGYPARFIEAPDRSAITAEILEAAAELPAGKVLYIPTDSKTIAKSLEHLLQQQFPYLRILNINSETSGGKDEREFVQKPDPALERGDYDVIICTPSLATGVSIEVQGIIQRVYGIFQGVSSTDADIAQTLIRAREPVERVIWCNRTGSNFSPISRSTNPLVLRQHLMSRTSATVSLTRSQLREDSLDALQGYDWQSDPHLQMWSLIEAERNRSMLNLRTALLVRLRHEGHQVTVEEHPSNKALKTLLKDSRAAIAQLDAESLVNADDYTYSEVMELQRRENLSPEQQQAIAKFYFKEFYAADAVTVDDVLADKGGRRRAELRSLEAQLYPETAASRDASSIDKQLEQDANWGGHVCPWDVGDAELRRKLREMLGLGEFLDPTKEWTKLDLERYAIKARELAPQVKVALKLTISVKMTDTQVVHQLLSQLGVKVAFRWSRSAPSLEGQKVRVYRLDQDHWSAAIAILERRKQRRDALQTSGSPTPLTTSTPLGDPDSDTPFQKGVRVRFGTSLSEWEVLSTDGPQARLRICDRPGWATELMAPIEELVAV